MDLSDVTAKLNSYKHPAKESDLLHAYFDLGSEPDFDGLNVKGRGTMMMLFLSEGRDLSESIKDVLKQVQQEIKDESGVKIGDEYGSVKGPQIEG